MMNTELIHAPLPQMHPIRQHLPEARVDDITGTLHAELSSCGVRIAPGARIAIAVGSRGIANLALIVHEICDWVKMQVGVPFIVPAMGSHGGATAEGQRAVLEGYGVSEEAMGAPILSSLEVVTLPGGDLDIPVYFDQHASQADGTIVVNRVKPHTSFHGRYESGLMKMLAIGLGKHRQALAIHGYGVQGLRELMPRVAHQVLQHGNVLLGVAVIENAAEQTHRICVVPAAQIPDVEPELLAQARGCLPRLPVDDIDILIVDEIGKNISGLGMDTNIIGRIKIAGQPEPERPRIRMIIARDLTADSHGNATGIGLADIITRRLFEKVDLRATYANVTTTGFFERGKIPLIAETDAEAWQWARQAFRTVAEEDLRVIRIKNTLEMRTMEVSAPIARELLGRDDVTVSGAVALRR